MRIIAGTAGGTVLVTPKGPDIRPTPDKVRQAIFSSLGERIVQARVLDLFTGTGALGLEAVSRGAAHVVLVDSARFCMEAVRANAAKARLTESVEVVHADALRFVDSAAAQGRQFDLILADPPYEKTGEADRSMAIKLLNRAALVSILAPNGVLAMEHYKEDNLEPPTPWRLHRQLAHGDTLVSFFVSSEPRP